MLPKKIKKDLEKQGYRIVGNHSAVKICRWTKKSLRNEGECYKSKFYGIDSWRCVQMTPSFVCTNRCLFCWRDIDFTPMEWNFPIDKPKTIIDNCIKEQRKLLEGFKILPETKHKTVSKVDMKKWQEAQSPKHMAISLSAEPTFYPKLPELIRELRKRKMTSFLVTNGLQPSMLRELKEKNVLPTQLYVSVNTPTEKLFRRITRNKNKDAWERLNETLGILPKLKGKTRTVFRMNLVKDLNMFPEQAKEYAKLIKKSQSDFIEIKSYMAVGHARQRLGYERMPTNKEMEEFIKVLLKELKNIGLEEYKLLDSHEFSRAYVLGKDKKELKIKDSQL